MIDHLRRDFPSSSESGFPDCKDLPQRAGAPVRPACIRRSNRRVRAWHGQCRRLLCFAGIRGVVWAAAIAALIDLLIASIVLLAASKSHPGPELV